MNNKLCTVGSLLSRSSWWKWALLSLLALYALLLVSRCSPIEQDLHARTTDALNEKGLNWAKPTLEKRGRDVMLSGEAPSEEAREQAINTAANVYGVRVVDNDITLKQYDTPVFGLLNNDEGKTVLTGSFPKQDLIDQAVRAASDNFGADNVINEMTVSEDVSSPSWLPAALAVMPAIVVMKDADLDINNDNASLNGTFHTDEEKQSLTELASTGFGDKFTDNSIVTPLPPTPEELAEIARKAEEIEAARIAEEARLAEAARISEEKRVAEEAEVARIAEEKRIADEAEAARLAEEKRIADAAEAARLANQKSMAAIMLAATTARETKAEAARLAEEKRLAEIARLAEEKRIAEEKRLAAEAEAARIANEKAMAAIMLAAQKGREAKAEAARIAEEKRIAEENRLAAEAEAARVANQKAMAAIMLAAQKGREAKAEAARLTEEKRIAEENRLAAEAEAARIANEKAMAAIMLAAQKGREAKAEAARLAEEKRIAEENRLAAEAEAARIANEKAMAAIMLAAQKGREAKAKAEEDRLAAEAEAARIANEKAMAAIMLAAQKGREAKAEAARLAEKKRLAEQAEAARLAAESRLATEKAKADCQQAIDDTMRGKRVLFATSSAIIDRQSYSLLNTLAVSISRCETRIMISGHTDSRGTEDMNMKLSQERAQSVLNYLNNQSIGRSEISSQGFGETSPIADNNSAAGRKLNRRIQFTILK